MSHPIKKILPDPQLFLDEVFLICRMKDLFVLSYELDHICYRVETIERYADLKNKLSKIADQIKESDVNGRLIAVYKLHQPIIFDTREIYIIELPAPKTGSPYPEGWEHAEFVLDVPLEEFVAAHPFADFDTKGIDKTINAEVRISVNGKTLKFHEQSLETIIENESQLNNE